MEQNKNIPDKIAYTMISAAVIFALALAFMYRKNIGSFLTIDNHFSFPIASDPSGAKVILDKKYIGETPIIINIYPGKHLAEIEKDNFQTKSVAFYADILPLRVKTAINVLNVYLQKEGSYSSDTESQLNRNLSSSVTINNSTVTVGDKNEVQSIPSNIKTVIAPPAQQAAIITISIGIFVTVVGGLILWFLTNKVKNHNKTKG